MNLRWPGSSSGQTLHVQGLLYLLRAFSGSCKECCETGRADDGRESTRHGSEDWRLGFQPTPVRLGRRGANGHFAPVSAIQVRKKKDRIYRITEEVFLNPILKILLILV